MGVKWRCGLGAACMLVAEIAAVILIVATVLFVAFQLQMLVASMPTVDAVGRVVTASLIVLILAIGAFIRWHEHYQKCRDRHAGVQFDKAQRRWVDAGDDHA